MDGEEQWSLLDCLELGHWYKLPVAMMAEVGPATQTFAGLLKITGRETFVKAEAIAKESRLPLPTVRKHLVVLNTHGWLVNRGRQETRSGRRRRTATIALTTKAKLSLREFAALPWWAAGALKGVGRLPWATRAVFGVVMARLMAIKATVERDAMADHNGPALDFEDLVTPERFSFSLRELKERTGLGFDSIVKAKLMLYRLGLVELIRNKGDDGAFLSDGLVPNLDLRAIVTPTTPGRCVITLRG